MFFSRGDCPPGSSEEISHFQYSGGVLITPYDDFNFFFKTSPPAVSRDCLHVKFRQPLYKKLFDK